MPEPHSGSTVPVELSDTELRQVPMLQLQVCFVALLAGPVFYAGFVMYMFYGEWSLMSVRGDELLKAEYSAFCSQILIFSFLVPWLISKFGVRRLGAFQGRETSKIFFQYRVQILAGVALLLPVVFYGVFWFSGSHSNAQSGNLAFMLLAAVYWCLIASRFPTRKRLQKWWARYRPFEVSATA
jgi:hypothetical protein